MLTGLVFNLQKYSVHDGPGIRTTVFLKGCPLDCWWCHNPESRSPAPQIMTHPNRCIRCSLCMAACPHGLDGPCSVCEACVDACPAAAREVVGRSMTVPQLMAQIIKDRIFYEQSGGGVTFSGGEPLMQFEFLIAALAACREQSLHTALDTCGFAPLQHLLSAAALADLVLYDIKLMDDIRHVRYTGVSNERILENLKALGRVHQNIWIRVPVIPGVNDSDPDLDAIGDFASTIPGVTRVCLLPYHATGIEKSRNLGQTTTLEHLQPPSSQDIHRMADRLKTFGLLTTIGK